VVLPSLSQALFIQPTSDSEQDGPYYDSFDATDAKYYQVATFPGGEILIDGEITPGPGGTTIARFIKDKNGKYYYLSGKNQSWTDDTISTYLKSDIPVANQIIKGVETPDAITFSGKSFDLLRESTELFNTIKNPENLSDTSYGTFYRVKDAGTNGSHIVDREFFLKLADQIVVYYKFDVGFDGYFNDISYDKRLFHSSSQCGGVSVDEPIISNSDSVLNDKVQVGKTASGQPLYQIKNPNNALVKELYDTVYNTGRDAKPIAEYAKLNNHLLYQDALGDWNIYINPDYGIMAECGKPVIYLYPPQKTDVTVKVGAKITKSEPTYQANGWTVTASPDGTLDYLGNAYSSLFWEGLGNGLYPDRSTEGVVVKQTDLITTVKTQLSQLGLNQKESADFMEFWATRLPKTPYVRLTWLNTQDMNILAPLTITPKPDTLIRIFLDSEGLNQPKLLTPQKLHTVKRNGFTVVEWGGLLTK
jgi:hypothetical protein